MNVQEKNKSLVLEAFDTLFNKRDYAAALKFWSPSYRSNPRRAPSCERRSACLMGFDFLDIPIP